MADDIDRTIAEQEEILDAGVTQTAVDGVTVTRDLKFLERRLSANQAAKSKTRKRTLSGIRLDL